jgi:ATP/maltotriose-dependent transcriptional regulator MalT
MMNYFSKSGYSQPLAQRQALLLDTPWLNLPTPATRDNTSTIGTLPLPDNGMQLVHWLECLPQDILDSHPRFSFLYIHALIFTQQFERARCYLQIIEHIVQHWETHEKESLQSELIGLRTYLTMHQELTSRYQETFHDLARFMMTTTVTSELPAKPAVSADPTMMHDALSKRELEVLSYIVTGMSNQEIARTIVVAVGTVKRHVNNIYNKLNVHSRIQVVRYAERHNLLPAAN